MKLTIDGISGNENKVLWREKGYALPEFDREKVTKNTAENPLWVHFGAGNIFRAFQANLVQRMLNQGLMDTGLIVAEGFDYEIIQKMYRPHQNIGLLATLKANGSVEKTVVGSILESYEMDSNNVAEYSKLKEIFQKDSLQMTSFTITEKGYSLVNGKGEQLPAVTEDMEKGPTCPQSYIGKVAALLYARFEAGEKPIAMVSMDNCSHNGDKLYQAVTAFAKAWVEKGLVPEKFMAYITDEKKVSFPWTMIDKITPRPDKSVEEILKKDGVEELEPVITSKNTYVAPFVNAEECEYLVVEDVFPNGRPALEKVGVYFTDRDTVNKVEKMKVCTCLNPLHTALAVFGCLLGYQLISKEMQDEELKKLVQKIGYVEGLPVVVNPGIIEPKKFIDQVVEIRIPNPFMPDTPQRIATDTSQKLGIRYGETIKAYLASDTLKVEDLKFIPMVFAGWARYLMAIDDNGNVFEPSSDPLLSTVSPYVENVKLGEKVDAHAVLEPIFSNEKIFGVDLYKAGLGELAEEYFTEMIAGKGAIRATLKKYL